MSSPPTIEPFRGINWEECNQFVRAIRAAAWKEGKLRDLAWVADFASLYFSHDALLWHSQLPQDVRQDWAKLEVALLTQWRHSKHGDEPPIEPIPAAAPSPNRSDGADRPLHRILKLTTDGSNDTFYLKLHQNGYGVVTNKASEALRFRCNSLSNNTLMERIDAPHHSWLGVEWPGTNPNLKNGSPMFGLLALVDSLSLKSSLTVSDFRCKLASCSVSANQEVILSWENDDASKITLGVFLRDGLLRLAADSSVYSTKYPKDVKAKIFIQPID